MSNDDADEPEWVSVYHGESPDFRRGWDMGWEAAYKELERKDWRYTPPLLRRFFWHPLDSFCEKPAWFIRNKVAATDEWCNPVVGIRLRGGVLYVRYHWKLRHVDSTVCKVCEEAGALPAPGELRG